MKGFWLAVVLLILIVPIASAEYTFYKPPGAMGACDELPNYLSLTCGNTPWSIGGVGAAELCGNCHACGWDDGVCPEDFYSSSNGGQQGSCNRCPDPDCTASISGFVKSPDDEPYSDAIVTALYAPYDLEINMSRSDENGIYYSGSIMSGKTITFQAIYKDDDNPLDVYVSDETYEEIEIIRGENYELNFTMRLSECESDCTRERSNKCDAGCDGDANGCNFPSNSDYTNVQTREKADGKLQGKRIALNSTTDGNKVYNDYFMSCDGDIETDVNFHYDTGQVDGSNDNIKNLVTRIHRVWYDGDILEMVIVYWDEEENK